MSKLGHVKALDGVRGLAILAVVGFHFFGLASGSYGVDLFFVLSGFLITTLLLEEHSRTGRIALGAFYVRRAKRLLPALGVLLLAIGIFGPLLYPTRRMVEVLAASVFYAANFVRAFATIDVFTGTPADHLWSLAQEEQFYLVWPALLIVLLSRITHRRILIGALALFVSLTLYRYGLVAAGADASRIYYGPDTHATGLVIGCAAAFARARGFTASKVAGFGGLAILVGAVVTSTSTLTGQVYVVPLVELASVAVILQAAQPGLLRNGLSLRPLPWLGALSYSLYLWHQFAGWITGYERPWLALAITIPTTLFSYYIVERPFRRAVNRRAQIVPAEAVPQAAA